METKIKLQDEDVRMGGIYASPMRKMYLEVYGCRYDRKVIGFVQVEVRVRGGTLLVGGVEWVARGSSGKFAGKPRKSTLRAFAAGVGRRLLS